jgi:hypothetical protein
MLTPPPIHLSEGTCINYRLHLFGVPFSWQSQMQRWNPPEAFVDTQRRGPYKLWVHTHRFHAQHGVTCIEDDVQYALPYWPFGELVYPLVRPPVGPHFSVSAAGHPCVFVDGIRVAVKIHLPRSLAKANVRLSVREGFGFRVGTDVAHVWERGTEAISNEAESENSSAPA